MELLLVVVPHLFTADNVVDVVGDFFCFGVEELFLVVDVWVVVDDDAAVFHVLCAATEHVKELVLAHLPGKVLPVLFYRVSVIGVEEDGDICVATDSWRCQFYVLSIEKIHGVVVATCVVVAVETLIVLDVFPVVVIPYQQGSRVELWVVFQSDFDSIFLSIHDGLKGLGTERGENEFFRYERLKKHVVFGVGENPHPREINTVIIYNPSQKKTLSTLSLSINCPGTVEGYFWVLP